MNDRSFFKHLIVFFILMKIVRIAWKYAISRFDMRIKLSAMAYKAKPGLGGWVFKHYHDLVHSSLVPFLVTALIFFAGRNGFEP